jgi:hypothetical protein
VLGDTTTTTTSNEIGDQVNLVNCTTGITLSVDFTTSGFSPILGSAYYFSGLEGGNPGCYTVTGVATNPITNWTLPINGPYINCDACVEVNPIN